MDGEEAENSGGVGKWCVLAKKKLQFIAIVSFFSFLFSYFSGFSSYSLHFSTLILSFFAHAADRKYMFLISNALLALLVNSFGFKDSTKQIPAILLVGEEGASLESVDEISPVLAGEEEMVHQNEFEMEEDDDEEEEGDEEESASTVEEVNDASVSTEELNQKCEEFIRKMKEEIRVEAQCKK